MSEAHENIFGSISSERWPELYDGDELDATKVLEISSLSKTQLADSLGMKNVRLEEERMSTTVRDRIREIANVIELAAEYFEGDRERVASWFTATNPLLGNVSPRDMIRFGRHDKLLKFILNSKAGNRIP